MKSDVVTIKSGGEGFAQALEQAESTARFRSLSDKSALYLRLLTEEMTGMFRAIAGENEADFWIEDQDRDFELHLKAETMMTGELRRKFLAVSTTGQNEAAKGFMGKIRQVFETALEPENRNVPSLMSGGWFGTGAAAMPAMGEIQAEVWSLNQYKSSLDQGAKDEEAWDELEKSVVSKLADDVRITIKKGVVELVICKKLV
ncbi:MAG: hypothetical protein IJU52_03380 [Clostridia bacterium]|nr:hypothetical protein [Clostridia bacterium]